MLQSHAIFYNPLNGYLRDIREISDYTKLKVCYMLAACASSLNKQYLIGLLITVYLNYT